jgi:glutathione S-transferase
MAQEPARLQLYDLAPSPNNIKVRLGLGFKGIPYDKIPVDPRDRAKVVEISGQPLTPVLVHGRTVIFDSSAILRYLEANFRSTPPLFAADRETMKAIETWEDRLRGELGEPIRLGFSQVLSREPDFAVMELASRRLSELTAPIEALLARQPWLVGERLTAADVAVAPCIYYGAMTTAPAEYGPIGQFFHAHLHLGDGRPRTRDWVNRVMGYDR